MQQISDEALVQQHQVDLLAASKTVIPYGTTGFRDKAHLLGLVSFRLGVFIAHYAKLKPTMAIGIQISASHNPVEDNGLKVTDWQGGMFDHSLEALIQGFCNAKSIADAYKLIDSKFPKATDELRGNVIIGWDTRPSCQMILNLLKAGLTYGKANFYEMGVVTTPMLHFAVWALNNEFVDEPQQVVPFYVESTVNAYKKCVKLPAKPQKVLIDGANGVGGVWMGRIQPQLVDYFDLTLINDGSEPSLLNLNCGSEYTQKQRLRPSSLPAHSHSVVCVSFDGDADRIVYFRASQSTDQVQVIEGDRFSVLIAMTIKRMLENVRTAIHLLNQSEPDLFLQTPQWNIGIVQTAYANGASTAFMKQQLQLNPCVEPTGVKYIHKRASAFDIGIYFEANGHGTILKGAKFEEHCQALNNALEVLREITNKIQPVEECLRTFEEFLAIPNQAVGDSITNFLLVQAALEYLNMSVDDWYGLYTDYPSITSKVGVSHKELLKVTYEENKAIEPSDIQPRIDEFLPGPLYRCFVRASGTEDVIRVYAEGPDSDEVAQLSAKVDEFIRTHPILNA